MREDESCPHPHPSLPGTDRVNLLLTTIWYNFNSQFYQQTGGVAMGGPASSTTAETYMQEAH